MDKIKSGWSVGRWILFILICCIVTSGSLRYSGFCFKEARYLSEEEKIRSAVEYVLQLYSPDRGAIKIIEENGKQKSVPANPIGQMKVKYKNTDEFFAKNTECCELTQRAAEGYGGSPIDWVVGYISTWVHVKYMAKYYDNHDAEYLKVDEAYVAVSSCGVAWDGM